ncbi:MAG: PAS domain S-box protein [Gemmatimonadota bacterium]
MPSLRLRALGALELLRGEEPLDTVRRQPKRFALLSYLVTHRPTPIHDRANLVGMFWPHLDQARARNSLSKALHFLRGALGSGVILSRGSSIVAIDPDQLSCDAWQFQQAAKRGEGLRVLQVLVGDFLPGVHASGAPDFGSWVDQERHWYREEACAVGSKAVHDAVDRGRIHDARVAMTTLERIAPTDERVVRAALRTLVAAGDRAGAIERLERYEAWLRDEFGESVSPELIRLLGKSYAGERGASPRVTSPGDLSPDVLEASRAALRLETLEDYREFVDLLPDMVYRCDIRGSFPFVNAELVRQMGYSPEELRDTPFEDLVREDYRDRVVDFYVRQVEERLPVTYLEFPALHKDGSEVWVGQKVRLILRDNEPVGVQVVCRDITVRVRRDAANRRAALEDRSTRLLNREAIHLLGEHCIRTCRRMKWPFFVIHVALDWVLPERHPTRSDSDRAVRAVANTLRQIVRDADPLARVEETELLLLSSGGGRSEAETMADRIALVLNSGEEDHLYGFVPRVQWEVHDPQKILSADAIFTVGRVLE